MPPAAGEGGKLFVKSFPPSPDPNPSSKTFSGFSFRLRIEGLATIYIPPLLKYARTERGVWGE